MSKRSRNFEKFWISEKTSFKNCSKRNIKRNFEEIVGKVCNNELYAALQPAFTPLNVSTDWGPSISFEPCFFWYFREWSSENVSSGIRNPKMYKTMYKDYDKILDNRLYNFNSRLINEQKCKGPDKRSFFSDYGRLKIDCDKKWSEVRTVSCLLVLPIN